MLELVRIYVARVYTPVTQIAYVLVTSHNLYDPIRLRSPNTI